MSTRRDIFKILAVTASAVPVLANAQEAGEVETQPGHLHADAKPVVKVKQPNKPLFLQPAEFATVEAFTERIIPQSDTPGARAAGVALLIDRAIVAAPRLMDTYRAGLADLDAQSLSGFGKVFVDLTEDQQVAVILPMSLQPDTVEGRFFTLVKDMTIDAYYKTEAGLTKELGWHGNTYLASFPGCQHPEHQT
jgi:gluconate 2-dehydrogenase gamma chain